MYIAQALCLSQQYATFVIHVTDLSADGHRAVLHFHALILLHVGGITGEHLTDHVLILLDFCFKGFLVLAQQVKTCLLYTSPSPRDRG